MICGRERPRGAAIVGRERPRGAAVVDRLLARVYLVCLAQLIIVVGVSLLVNALVSPFGPIDVGAGAALLAPDGSRVLGAQVAALSAAEREALQRHPTQVLSRPTGLLVPLLASSAAQGGAPIGGYLYLPDPALRPRPASLLALTGANLVALGLVALWWSRALARPLRHLQGVARAIGEGDLRARAALPRRDAFGALGSAIDAMAERIFDLLRAQRELLVNISHELRTPMARIRVALEIASEGRRAWDPALLRGVSEDLRDLERLVGDVLMAARLDRVGGVAPAGLPMLQLTQVTVAGVIAATAARFRETYPQRALEVDVASSAAGAVLGVDCALVVRALLNLLDNAHKHSPPGAPVHLRAVRLEGRAQITVWDKGEGVDAADLVLLGTPFFRADRSRDRRTGGVGLGLALTRRIIDAHAGQLELRSPPGEGLTATILLGCEDAL